jgi:electron transfer flavoprotein beta subunit
VEILVCVKRVPDSEAQIEVKEGKALKIEEKYTMNFFDNLAVEEALRIKEKVGGKVTVLTFGSASSLEVLRTALAMGADEAILIEDENIPYKDEFVTAKVLSKVIKDIPYDLILCGREAFDTSSGLVGPFLGKMLGIPVITMVTKVEVKPEERQLEVEREIEEGRELLKVKLPALLTTQKGLNEPRVPTVMGLMKAMKASIKRIKAEDLGIKPDSISEEMKVEISKLWEEKKKRQIRWIKGTPVEMVKELIELLKTEARVL